MDPESGSRVQRPVRTTNGTTLALIGGLIVLVLVIAYFATRGNSNQDKLTENEVTQNATKAKALAPEKLCASNQTYDLIKRELFRRAAQLRGSDQAAFDQLSAYAVVRMENPVMESQDNASGAVNCSGNLSLDLPPGVRIVGGRQTLTSDVDYTVQAAADGSGKIVLLRSADAVIAPLATLARANQQAQISTATAPAPEVANEVGSDQQQLDVRTEGSQPRYLAPTCRRRRIQASTAQKRAQRVRSPSVPMPVSRPSIGMWPTNTDVQCQGHRRHKRRCFARLAIASFAIATVARTARASAMPMSAACARSATSWKGAGSLLDKRG